MLPSNAIRRFLQLESAGGITLVCAALCGLICANVPGLNEAYERLLGAPMEVRVGGLHLKKTVLLFINDGLMAVFFLLVALEIKREALEGELSSPSRLALPVFAAAGGLAIPAVIYALLNRGDAVAMRGWAIPTATDIAFSLAVLTLLGSRVPLPLKVFLTAVAVVDDLAAIVIIALFYTGDLSVLALGLAGASLVGLLLLNVLGVRRYAPYFLVGAMLWVCVLKSGVHATLAGVVVGLLIPHRGSKGDEESPLLHLEHVLHPWVAFMILPLFAFGNAGVSLAGVTADVVLGGVSRGIVFGLLIGKPVGIALGVFVVTRLGLAQLPEGVSWRMILGTGMLCGIGFTMSLFVGMLAFEGQDASYGAAVRMSVLVASLVAAVIGYVVLRRTLGGSTARGMQ